MKARLGDVCRFERGTSPTLKTEPGPFPLVVTAGFRRSASTWQLQGPAICIPLVSSTGHGDAALHRIHYQEGRFALANLLVALVPSRAVIAKYLYYLLTALKDDILVPLMVGTANVSLKEQDIADVAVELPGCDEQQRVVNHLEQLEARIAQAKTLRRESCSVAESLLVAMAHRADLSPQEKTAAGWIRRRISDVATSVDDSWRVEADRTYPNLGIYSFGRGLFHKPPIDGAATSATAFRRVRAGQFIYSRLFAFEGAFGYVSREYDGAFVSQEYPTFDCDPEHVRAEFLAAYFKPEHVWKEIAKGSKGLGDRRQRVQPAQVLAHELWVPPMRWQDRLANVQAELAMLSAKQNETAAGLDALLPALLDKAFKGKL